MVRPIANKTIDQSQPIADRFMAILPEEKEMEEAEVIPEGIMLLFIKPWRESHAQKRPS